MLNCKTWSVPHSPPHSPQLFRGHLACEMIDEIRKATNGNYALGTERFRRQVENALGRRVEPGRAGRPKIEGVLGC